MRAFIVWILRMLLDRLAPPPRVDDPLDTVDGSLTSPDWGAVGYRFGYGPAFFEPADAILDWGDDK